MEICKVKKKNHKLQTSNSPWSFTLYDAFWSMLRGLYMHAACLFILYDYCAFICTYVAHGCEWYETVSHFVWSGDFTFWLKSSFQMDPTDLANLEPFNACHIITYNCLFSCTANTNRLTHIKQQLWSKYLRFGLSLSLEPLLRPVLHLCGL